MIKALIYKEWIKVRYIFILPFIVILLALCDYYWTLLAVQSMHGAINLWAGLVFKETVYFENLKYVFIFSGIWYAYFQLVPECTGKKLRLFFHLPISYKVALFITIFSALFLFMLLFLVCFLAFSWINTSLFNFPKELSIPMVQTIYPWVLAGFATWCLAGAIIADPSFIRKIALGAIAYVYIQILTNTAGFAGMGSLFSGSLIFYVLICIPLPFALISSCLRIKEGR